VAHLVSSLTALSFLTNVSEKCKSASPLVIQVTNWQKTIGIEEKLYVISQLEKGEQIVDICCNVRLTHSSIHIIRDNADGIKECAKSGTKVFVWQDYYNLFLKPTSTHLLFIIQYNFLQQNQSNMFRFPILGPPSGTSIVNHTKSQINK
jgi:hypothetical protein